MKLLLASEKERVLHFHSLLSIQYAKSSIGGVLWSQKQLLTALEGGNVWGAFCEIELVALVVLREEAEVIHLDYLATQPAFQGKGYISSIFRHLTEKAKVNSQAIWLEVSAENKRARSLYSKFSFQVVGERVNYYKNGDNALLYSFNPQ